MRKYKIPVVASLALALFLATPVSAFAQTEEERSKYEDNVIDYNEINYLVQNYNTNVINNNKTYKDIKKNNQDTANTLRDKAEELQDKSNDLSASARQMQQYGEGVIQAGIGGIPIDNTGFSGYGTNLSAMYSGAAQLEIASNQLNNQADSLESSSVDKLMYRIQFDKVEAQIINSVQGLYNNYYQLEESLKQLREGRELYVKVYESAVRRQSIGMATELEVTDAKKQITTMENNITALENQKASLVQSICLLIGRDYNSEIALGNMPQVDYEYIARINVEENIKKAIGNSYTLQYSRRELSNLTKNSDKIMKNSQITLEEQSISSRLTLQNQTIKDKQAALTLATDNLAQEEGKMQQMQRKFDMGMVSKLEYDQQLTAYNSQSITVNTETLNLFLAVENYKWIVNGI